MSVTVAPPSLVAAVKRGTNVTIGDADVSSDAGNVAILVTMIVTVVLVVGILIYIIASPRGIPCCRKGSDRSPHTI